MKLLKINRNGEEIELTKDEMISVYREMREYYMKDWVVQLLDELGYDTDKVSDDLLEQIYLDYMETMEMGDSLGELEHDAIWFVVDEPEIAKQLKGCEKDDE